MCYDEPRRRPRKPVVVAAELLRRGDALGNEAAHVILELEKKLKDSTNRKQAMSYHGCTTGDCPHGDVNDCVKALGVHCTELEALVATLPKDADGEPVVEGHAYYFPCANGVLEFHAYLSPQSSPVPAYPWHHGHSTREAAAAVAKEGQDGR